MPLFQSRAGRWPLAFAIVALAACSNEPVSPTLPSAPRPNADIADPLTVANANDDGIGSLRWVLRYAAPGETVRFDPGLAGQTISLDSVLIIEKSVTIEGPATKGITLSGQGTHRVVYIKVPAPVTLRNLSITGGATQSVEVGAAIITGPDATELLLENIAVYGNTAGIGVVIYGGQIKLINSTVSGNGTLSAITSEYGAVHGKRVEVINSTVSNNGGNGVGAFTGGLLLKNSIIANNPKHNCAQLAITPLTREGANISDDETCGGPAEIMIGDPEIGPLADNGGPSMTHALLVGSPAINAGVSCGLTTDQRYVPRDAQCDIGAYEFTTPTSVTLTIDGGVAVNQSNGWAVVTGTVTCSRNESFSVAVQLEQQQKSGKTKTTVDAAAIVPVDCATTPRPWIASMILTSGEFTTGTALAKAQTVYTPKWVTPTGAESAVKLYWARR